MMTRVYVITLAILWSWLQTFPSKDNQIVQCTIVFCINHLTCHQWDSYMNYMTLF